MSNNTWYFICELNQIPNSMGVAAKLNQDQIALFRVQDHVFALNNYCPFGKANVISRGLVGSLKEQIVVASPLYKQHFVLNSGVCLEDQSVKIQNYPVKIEDNKVFVQSV